MKKVAALLLLVGTAFASSAFTGCDTGPSSCELAQTDANACGIPGGGTCDEGVSDHTCIARCVYHVGITRDAQGNPDCTRLSTVIALIKGSNEDIDQNRNDLDLIFEDIDRLKDSFAGEFPDAGPDADPDQLQATRPVDVDEDLEVCIANCWI